ncbi:hypothetical protein MMC13_003841 [Lambiella insularis]|nr:hypothetical protein [Lambiella insularis]
MFTSRGVAGQLPIFETRKALIILNLQNCSFDTSDGFAVCEPQDFVEKVKEVVPVFRKTGEIVWIRTEFEDDKTAPKPSVADREDDGHGLVGKETHADTKLGTAAGNTDRDQVHQVFQRGIYFPTSRTKAVMRHASARTRSDQRNGYIESFVNDDDTDAYLSKPRKGQPPNLFAPGTYGAALTDDIIPYVDSETDMMIVKNHYSAFDATPLLLSLRMKLVTHIYLCGLLSNVSIYSTAADAVRHGFEVTVIEDCMGYRSQEKHLDAMRQMADMLGVSGTDSDEIIAEAGGTEPPDAEIGIFSGPGLDGIHAPAKSTNSRLRGPGTNHDIAESKTQPRTNNVPARLPVSVTDTFKATEEPSPISYIARSAGNDSSPTKESPRVLEEQLRKPQKITLRGTDKIGECDSRIILDALSREVSDNALKLLKKEVQWETMHHRGGEVPRKIAVQGQVDKDGSMPIYRHPADESPPLLPFSETVQTILEEVQQIVKQPLNHALIQLYRNGNDNISEHADKTLDIVRESSIVNVSLGAQRTMTLRTKRDRHSRHADSAPTERQSQRIPLPHSSIFILGPQTNRRWLHGIRPDKRDPREKSLDEKASSGERISITFRNIGTFTDKSARKIWGQGALSKHRVTARTVTTRDSSEMEAMIEAFGKENQQADFEWDKEYGDGFNVINLRSGVPELDLCQDKIANLRVLLSILERGVQCKVNRIRPSGSSTSGDRPRTMFALSGSENPVLRDIDEGSSEIVGDLAVLFYLDNFYPIRPSTEVSARQLHRLTSQVFSRVTQANEILFLWQELRGDSLTASTRSSHSLRRRNSNTPGKVEKSAVEEFEGELEIWEEYAEETEYVGGDFYATVDCAFWPVLNDIVTHWERWSEKKYPDLAAYHRKVAGMESVQKAVVQIA